MIKHIVMWKVRGDTPQEKAKVARFVKSRFEGLIGRIPGLTKLEVGLDSSGVDYACDVVLYTEFENQEALDAYQSVDKVQSKHERHSILGHFPI
jgi:hypothetical protein